MEADMKKILVYILIMVSISACAKAASGKSNCSMDGDVCIQMQVHEPVLYGGANTLTITVSSTIDINDLGIYLSSRQQQILIEDTNGWSANGVNWSIDIQANQPQTFTKDILLPGTEGYFHVIADAFTPQEHATHSFYIVQKNGTSTIYYNGTPIPTSNGPISTTAPEILLTLQAMPTRTLFPTLTPLPTKTSTSTPVIYPPPATPDLDRPGTPYP
jgi:hypothetical protein